MSCSTFEIQRTGEVGQDIQRYRCRFFQRNHNDVYSRIASIDEKAGTAPLSALSLPALKRLSQKPISDKMR